MLSNGVQQQQLQITTLPPLMTTLSQNSYLTESLAQSKQAQDDLHPASERSSDSHRLNSEDHDDSVPLATINNHSRNQPAARPPQYVDVSALVGVSNLIELARLTPSIKSQNEAKLV